uniref:Calponin-homology (CH) domain-containing protein n=1 Tax=Plectus sambesii TaxID=2011161 RepID=A0A914X5K0_9BILA
MAATEREFWSHPLAAWLRHCLSSPPALISESEWCAVARRRSPMIYADLCDAVAINLLFLHIDPRPTNQKTAQCDPADVSGRLKNLTTLLRNLQSFYKVRVLCNGQAKRYFTVVGSEYGTCLPVCSVCSWTGRRPDAPKQLMLKGGRQGDTSWFGGAGPFTNTFPSRATSLQTAYLDWPSSAAA